MSRMPGSILNAGTGCKCSNSETTFGLPMKRMDFDILPPNLHHKGRRFLCFLSVSTTSLLYSVRCEMSTKNDHVISCDQEKLRLA